MMKLQLSGKRNNYTNLSFRAKQGGTERGNRYSLGGGQASTRQKNMQQQSTKQIPSRQGDNKAVPSNPTERVPREQVWVVNVEAVTRAKKFKGEDTLTLAQRIRLNQSCLVTKKQLRQNFFRMRLWCSRYSKRSLLWKQIRCTEL